MTAVLYLSLSNRLTPEVETQMTNDLPPAGVPARQYSKAERHAVNRLLLDRHATGSMCRELKAERARQDVRWGEQNHPDMTGQPSLEWFTAQAERSRERAEHHARTGTLAWDHILQEEWDEAREQAAYGNTHALRTELVQVMAVAAAWVEAIDRREVAAQEQRHRFEEDEAHPGPMADWERELIDVSSATDPHPHMRSAMAGHATGPTGAQRFIGGLGMTEQTRNALADMGYVVQEWQEPHLDAIVVSKPERGKAQAYLVDEAGRTVPSEAAPEAYVPKRAPMMSEQGPVHRENPDLPEAVRLGAAGQPVTSYSGGGVRDVTEGKPRIDLMWPLGVPFEAQMLTRVGVWLERGMQKYAERNWEKFHTPEALNHAIASLSRHYAAFMSGADDEDHLAAIVTNVIFISTVQWKLENDWHPEGCTCDSRGATSNGS